MYTPITVEEKLSARARHMDNLNRLRSYSKLWNPESETYVRAEATMTNLMQQVLQLDDELLNAGVDMRMEA